MSRQVDAVMAAARVLVAVVASSLVEVEERVSLPQLRVLVMLAMQGPLNLAAVAQGLGVHPSNATRTVDRLVVGGFVDRRDVPADRRNVSLTLTKSGQDLVDSVFEHRRAGIKAIVERMPEVKRRALPNALESFAAAAGVPPEHPAGDMQWIR
jgi:DNA-binding MarR family transcriptional regulator